MTAERYLPPPRLLPTNQSPPQVRGALSQGRSSPTAPAGHTGGTCPTGAPRRPERWGRTAQQTRAPRAGSDRQPCHLPTSGVSGPRPPSPLGVWKWPSQAWPLSGQRFQRTPWVQAPSPLLPPSPSLGRGVSGDGSPPPGPSGRQIPGPTLPLTRPGTLGSDCCPPQTQCFHPEKGNSACQTFFF